MKFLAVLAFLPGAAFASALETDFDQIFEDNAALVEQSDAGSSVELPNKILVSRNAEGKYLALDGSPHEAVGCVLRITLQSVAVVGICPATASQEQTETLQSNVTAMAEFYAANNIPARDLALVQAEFDSAISSLKQQMNGVSCEGAEIDNFKAFLATLIGEDSQAKLRSSLAAPRLPVTQPCL